VKTDLNEGLAALYSFWFAEAHKNFEKAAIREPGCAIAYWGEAMSNYEQIEGGSLPEGRQLEDGQAAIAKADAAPQKTTREQAYIDAIAIIFDATGTPDHDTRVRRFSAAMGAISAAYPADYEAAVIYAMSLLKGGMPDDPDLILSKRALAILNGVLKVEPDNPGAIHFIIHATDNPRMAPLGLAAARRYAKIAPAAPHALHMPGHIFARLGLWDEDISSNLASKAAAEQPALMHTEAQNRAHAMEFLQYAYLQTGQIAKAEAIMAEAQTIRESDFSPGFARYYPYLEAGFPTRLAIETGDWPVAMALQPAPGADNSARSLIDWAQALAAGHLGNAGVAERAEARYRATFSAAELAQAEANPSSHWAETKAWTLFATGDTDGAIAMLRPVADLQDREGKGEVELPAREMIGDMFRIAGQPGEALREYRRSLRTDPGRFNTLLHAGEVAEKLGRDGEAAGDYRLLLRNTAYADLKVRRALEPAYAFAARHPL
jgi:tetratricopeptide (TPR) repeat protein